MVRLNKSGSFKGNVNKLNKIRPLPNYFIFKLNHKKNTGQCILLGTM